VTEWLEERQRVLQAAQQLLAKRLTVGSSGNVSQRLGDELLAITPNRRYTEDLAPADIVVATFEGDVVAGEGIPSSELMMHVGVYQARPDVLAVIHAHPRYVSAAAVTGRAIPPILEDQMIYLGGQIEVAGHAMSGSDELAAAAVAALGDRHACLLANHGAMAVGRDLRAALYACEYLEKLCQAFLWASLLGPLNVLPPDVVETERAFFKMMRM
jgi:L-fuculose-phosphate aldolase